MPAATTSRKRKTPSAPAKTVQKGPASTSPRKAATTKRRSTPAAGKPVASVLAKQPRKSAQAPAAAKRASRKAAQPAPAPRQRSAKPAASPAPVATPTAATAAELAAHPRRRWIVRSSPIHGRGVFAARDIKKNRTIIEYKGDRTSWKKAMKRPLSDPDNPYHTFLFGLDDGRVIDADVGGNEARWINHSCKPNCETEEDEKGRVFIKSRRKIAAGEELTYDYQLNYDGKMGKKMRAAYDCRCGAKTCRGTMLAKDQR